MTGADFRAVGSEGQVPLSSITVGGSAYPVGASDAVVLQILNYNGTPGAAYQWLDVTGDFDPGWYVDYEPAGEVYFDLGDAMWVTGDDGYELKYSGEVASKIQIPVPLRFGNTAVANPFPTRIDLTTVTVGGTAYVAGSSDAVVVQKLNYNGTPAAGYQWLDVTGDFDPGWYVDYEPIEAESVYLEPGEGLWVTGDDGLDIQFPALVL